MIPENKNPSAEDIRKATRMLQMRMLNSAFFTLTESDRARCVYFRISISSTVRRYLLAISWSSMYYEMLKMNTVKISQIALLSSIIIEGEKSERLVVELSVLLLSETQEVREASLHYIEKMVAANSFALTPKTADLLKDSRDALVSHAPEKWRSAGVVMFDALNDDILVALHGTHQSLACEPAIKESLNTYAPKVLHPSVSSLDSITLSVSNIEKDHESLAKLV